MKQFYVTLSLLFAVLANGWAKEVDPEQARQKVLSFLTANSNTADNARFAVKSVNDVRLCHTSAENGTTAFYVFNTGSDGFVIVSAEDRTEEILGYSTSGQFDEENIPDGMRELLQDYARQIVSISKQPETQARMNRAATSYGTKVIKTALWGQGAPYNTYCPAGCPTGCVATAMGIVMRHYWYPEQGRGSHSYVVPYTGETLSADFSTHTYNWSAMPLTNAISATDANYDGVARLMADLGIATEMNYEPGGSGTSIQNARQALVENFCYSPKARVLWADDFPAEEWSGKLREEINNDRLVIYSGNSDSDGHAFVVDGYSDEMFSINWGWDGYCNGHFTLGRLQPDASSGNYSTGQSALMYLMPSDGTENILSPMVLYTDEYGYSGIASNSTDVRKGEIYSVVTGNLINAGKETFDGTIYVGLFNQSGELKETISNGTNINLGSNWYYSELTLQCNLTVDAVDGDFIALVTRATGSNEYLLVGDENLNVCKIPATNHIPKTVTVNFEHTANVTVSPYDGWNFYYQSKPVVGSSYYFKVQVPEDAAKVVVRCDDRTLTPSSNGLYDAGRVLGDMTVTVKAYAETDLTPTLKVHLDEAGTLENTLQGCDFDAIQSIEISGYVDQRDFVFLNQYFTDIDMHAATILAYGMHPANTIPISAFTYNRNLTRFIMPAGTTSIGSNAFMQTSLTEVTIPAGVDTYGVNVFNACRQLKDVTVLNPEPAFINWCVLWGTLRDEGGTLHVPAGAKNAYEEAEEWNQFTYIVEDAVDIYVGIGDVDAEMGDAGLFSLNGNTVTSATGKTLHVYDLTGRSVAQGTSVTLQTGAYIIVSGKNRMKTIIK